MERNEIIKALECCSPSGKHCTECVYFYRAVDDICAPYLMADALALINSQEQRIKELTEENERLRAENEALAISEVKECEISQMLVYRIRNKHPAVMAVIADTVKKFADSLKAAFPSIAEAIDYIAKEMVEGEK